MSWLMWNQTRAAVPSTEEAVNTTVTVVENDEPAAVQEHAPDFNETFTDPDTQGGLTPRQLASHVDPVVKYVPNVGASAQDEHNGIVNVQVSTSGTAAAREAAGQWGHGTMKVVTGIEPTLVDGHALGSEYFKTHERPDSASGSYMTPSATADPGTVASVGSTGARNARGAVNNSQYAAYYAEVTGLGQ